MLPYDTRPHRWNPEGCCVTCGMRSSWEGARYACTGVSAHVKQVGGGRPKGAKGTCSHCQSPDHNRQTCPEKPGRLTDAEYARRYRERHRVAAAPTTHACGICGKTWTREPKCGRMPLYCSVRCTRRAFYVRHQVTA